MRSNMKISKWKRIREVGDHQKGLKQGMTSLESEGPET